MQVRILGRRKHERQIIRGAEVSVLPSGTMTKPPSRRPEGLDGRQRKSESELGFAVTFLCPLPKYLHLDLRL